MKDNQIVFKEGMSQTQTLKTLIHEITHARLYGADGEKMNRNNKEVEAESVAYAVCQYFGIDSSEYSFGYIAGWSKGKELNELRSSMQRIRKTTSEMLSEVEKNIETDKIMEKETGLDGKVGEGHFYVSACESDSDCFAGDKSYHLPDSGVGVEASEPVQKVQDAVESKKVVQEKESVLRKLVGRNGERKKVGIQYSKENSRG
ncbi:hypothetical protein SAMN02910358_01852 [Lachnospiraceae bacterium XBB1006]|nr:hypothetical protein SAMN02910358_01852 [Lachnospiraceae bacterium XBB1006]